MQRLKHHPDLGGDAATAALINEAYAVLCDAERRAEYDAYLNAVDLAGRGFDFASQHTAPGNRTTGAVDPYRECAFCRAAHEYGKSIRDDISCSRCNSPLFPAVNHRLESSGQRAVARIGKHQNITFYTTWPQSRGLTSRTEDISLNGMRFVTHENLIEGQNIKIVSHVVDAVAQVSNFSRKRRGLRLTSLAGVSCITSRFGRSIGRFVSDHT